MSGKNPISILRVWCIAATTVAWLLPAGAQAYAQALERHVPDLAPPDREPGLDDAATVLQAMGDDTPIGVTLRRIVVIEDDGSLVSRSGQPVELPSNVPGLHPNRLAKSLSRYLGRPVSRRGISEIGNDVVMHMRRSGYPMVSIAVPEQEIGTGVLYLRLFSFRLGTLTVEAPTGALEAHVRKSIRQQVGHAISMGDLAEDIDALNENPFRSVTGSFARGSVTGLSDIVLTATQRPTVRAYLGMIDVGNRDQGGDRYYAGLQVGWPAIDLVVAYQLTGSRDFWVSGGGSPFPSVVPRYVSHGITAFVPLGPRHGIEATLNLARTHQMSEPLDFRNAVREASLGYRGTLSDFLPLRGSLRLGVEARRQERSVRFFDEEALRIGADIFQLYAGWAATFRDGGGATDIDLSVHASPGGITTENTAVALGALGEGSPVRASYAYIRLDAQRVTLLSFGLALENRINVQWTGGSLPATEQTSLGGPGGVRAYGFDAGSADAALILSNRLSFRRLSIGKSGQEGLHIRPYIFSDVGWAHDHANGKTSWAESAGLGASVHLNPAIGADAAFGCTVQRLGAYGPGECRIMLRVSVSR